MIKRVFVLLLCFALIFVFALFSGKPQASYSPVNEIRQFSPYAESSSAHPDENLCEIICHENIPIIRTDVCKWKEDLRRLLRHKHSSFGRASFSSLPSAFIYYIICIKGVIHSFEPIFLYKNIAVVPGYYSFLHRLCPF